eukprot:jgi/Ulvmu1/8122/UM040_0017.1
MPRSIYNREAQDTHAFEVGASLEADQENALLAERVRENSRMLQTGTDSNGVPIQIRYCVLGESSDPLAGHADTRPRVLMIMGLAASLDAWKPQILDMLAPQAASAEPPMVMCLLDNRGVGESSCPARKADYSTAAMAADAAAVLDYIGWRRVHVVGFSMGGMVAAKFAATWPGRTASLSVVSTSRGNWDSLPRSWRALKYVFMISRDRSPRMRARIDLKFHFSRRTLYSRCAGWGRRQDGLLVEYMRNAGAGEGAPPSSGESQRGRMSCSPAAKAPMLPREEQSQRDPEAGLRGQMSAVWRHKLSKQEKATLRNAPFPRLVIHGRHDIVAAPAFGEKVAREIAATMVMLEGAHFIPRERGHDVSLLLEGVILGQPRQAERQHLDPMRHMQPDTGAAAASDHGAEAAPAADANANGMQGAEERQAGRLSAGSVQLQTLTPAAAT